MIKLEIIILYEVLQTHKDKYYMLYLIYVSFESLNMCVSFEVVIKAMKLLRKHVKRFSREGRERKFVSITG